MILHTEYETLPREDLERLQLTRLRATVERCYHTVGFYREAMDGLGVKPRHIQSVADVRLLPYTKKEHLRDNYPFGMFAVPTEQVVRVHASSGTTGKPTVVGYTARDIKTWAQLMARSLAAAGMRPGDRLHNSYGYGLFTGGLGAHYGGEELGVMVTPMSGGRVKRSSSSAIAVGIHQSRQAGLTSGPPDLRSISTPAQLVPPDPATSIHFTPAS